MNGPAYNNTGGIFTVGILCHLWWDLLMNFSGGKKIDAYLHIVLKRAFQVFYSFFHEVPRPY